MLQDIPKYSVVLRVYNEGKALLSSVESVINQGIEDWELVIIDDGSETETQTIVDQCGEKDQRIRVIHQENRGGLGALRRGIRESKGKYVAFLDAGDTYEPEFLETADELFRSGDESVDMVSFGLREVFPDHDRTYCIIEGTQAFSPRELMLLMECTTSYYSLWLRVTKREMFRYTQQEERFYDQVGKSGNFGDDLYLLSPALCNCRKIVVTDQPLYRYQYDENSISRQFHGYTWKDAWNRNRLVEFTYQTMRACGYMDTEMQGYIQNHAVVLLIPCAKWIVRHSVKDRETQRLFKDNQFFHTIVSKNGFGRSILGGIKSKVALELFKLMVLCA